MVRARVLAGLGSILLLTLVGVRPTRADDPKPGADDSTLRLFHLAALVAGRQDFIGTRMGLVGPDSVSDEEHPLFGAEAEEPLMPVGSLDEVIELLKSEVEPESWSSVSGVAIAGMGSDVLVVRQRPEALVAMGAAIKRWEERWLRSVTVEVRAVHLPPATAAPSAADLAALLASEAAGPGVSVTGMPGQRVTAVGGSERTYVQDYDVEVAPKAKGADPIVGVASLGLAVDLRAVPSSLGDRVSLLLQGGLTEWLGAQQLKAVEGGTLEAPILSSATLQATLDVPAGVWTLVDGAAALGGQPGWSFAVRARVNPPPPVPAGKGDGLPVLASAGMGKIERRAYDVSALLQRAEGHVSRELALVPSNYTPPEPPELPEPHEAIAGDALLSLLRNAIAPEVWEKGSLEIRKDTLIVRAPDVALLAIERTLGALRRSLVWSVEVDGEVLEVPANLDVASESLLSDASAKALDAARADGTAKTVDRVRVSSFRGARNNVTAGRDRAYLQDYEVEIAEDSVIGNPVVRTAFTGVVLDVQPSIDSTGSGAAMTVRFTRTWLPEQIPTFATPWGELQIPQVRMVRLRTTVEAPFGQTTVVGSSVENGRRTVLLLTPRLKRSGD